MAKSTMAGAFMVIDVLTLSRGMPSINSRMSASEEIETPTFPTSPNDISSSASRPSCVGRSNATDNPFWPLSSRSLKRSFVAVALENPAYCLIVQSRDRYIVECMPRVYGGEPASPRSVSFTDRLESVSEELCRSKSRPLSVFQSSLR